MDKVSQGPMEPARRKILHVGLAAAGSAIVGSAAAQTSTRQAAGQDRGTNSMTTSSTPARSPAGQTAIVLVHGGFVDGSGWESVYHVLKKEGYAVSVVQNSTISLAGDVSTSFQPFHTVRRRSSEWPPA